MQSSQEMIKPFRSDNAKDYLIDLYKKHLRKEDIDESSSFYQSGGTSLTATLLLADLLSDLGIRISFDDFDSNNTPDTLAHMIAKRIGKNQGPEFRTYENYSSDTFVLSSAQKSRCWYHSGFRNEKIGDNGLYNVCSAYWLNGNLDIDKLQEAFNLTIGLHDSLGMSFFMENGNVMQTYSAGKTINVVINEAEDSIKKLYQSYKENPADFRISDHQIIKEFMYRPFDWNIGETVRCCIYKVDDSTYLLIAAYNHITFDFISKKIFIRDLCKIYNYLAGEHSVKVSKSVQFRDFLEWEKQYAGSQQFQHNLKYWTDYLSNSKQDIHLPTRIDKNKARSKDALYNQAKKYVQLGTTLSTAVKTASKDCDVTPYVMLFSAFCITIAKLQQDNQLTIGSQIANRLRKEAFDICGCFAQPIAVVANLDSQESLRGFLHALHSDINAAMEQQPVSLPAIAKALQRDGNRRFHPLYQCVFEYFNVEPEPMTFSGIHAEELFLPYHFGYTSTELMLMLWEKDNDISGVILYADELYDNTAIDTVTSTYIDTLNRVVKKVDISVAELSRKAPALENS